MLEQVTYKIRLYYRKQERLALLSHLEVARALERAVRRAKLPYAVSQGFSPHMKIAFGEALPVGVGGLHECFDLSLTRYIPAEEVVDALKKASVEDLMVFEGDYVGRKEAAPSVAFPLSTYRVELSQIPKAEPIVPETVTVIRKKKERRLVVREYLLNDIVWDGPIGEFSLLAKPTGSLRPDRLLDAVLTGHERIRVVSLTRVHQRKPKETEYARNTR